MVDIGGYEVHADLMAGDDPPVLAVSALGTDSAHWRSVIDRLATAHP
jgi:hypothetical protein